MSGKRLKGGRITYRTDTKEKGNSFAPQKEYAAFVSEQEGDKPEAGWLQMLRIEGR